MKQPRCSCRTNYFRTTDEKAYQDLFERSGTGMKDLSYKTGGSMLHGFGSQKDSMSQEDIQSFVKELQRILPEDEAFMYFQTGSEGLRYLTGYVLVCTRYEIREQTLDRWAKDTANSILGTGFRTTTCY